MEPEPRRGSRMEHEATQLEKQHVHSVYENTAAYFSDLQTKAWPRVRNFLLEQKPGSLVVDIGCGTGKYLSVNSQVYNLGCDYCEGLVEIARKKGDEVLVCDNLNLPFRDQCFNAVISIGAVKKAPTNSNPDTAPGKQRRRKEENEQSGLHCGYSAWLFHVGPEPAAGFKPFKGRVPKTAESKTSQDSSKASSI